MLFSSGRSLAAYDWPCAWFGQSLEGPQKGDVHTMSKITVGIHAVLKKDEAKDIDLVVHQYYVGQPSPCVVIRDGDRWGVGGNIETIEEILEFEISKNSGYTVQQSAPIEFA